MSVPVVRHFLVCHHVEYDFQVPLAPYSLQHPVFRARPPAGGMYPFVVPDLWFFVLLVGTGVQELWVEVAFRFPGEPEADEDVERELVAVYGPFVARFGPDPINLPRAWHLRAVPFPRPGAYEFRLLHEGVALAEEFVQLED